MTRECSKDYRVPGTDYVVPRGMFVNLRPKPGQCFSKPDLFDPDNFSESGQLNKFGFYAFGHGPRSCIGKYMFIKILFTGVDDY